MRALGPRACLCKRKLSFCICTNITKTYIWVVYGSGLNEPQEENGIPAEVNLGKGRGIASRVLVHIWLGFMESTETSEGGVNKNEA